MTHSKSETGKCPGIQLSLFVRAQASVAMLALMASCNQGTMGTCIQSVGAQRAADLTLGGFVTVNATTRCSMQLRLLDKTSTGFRARLETANHCTESIGRTPETATLSIYLNSGYYQNIRFKSEFAGALSQINAKAAEQGPGQAAFADWATLPSTTRGQQARTAGSKPFERDLLVNTSGCPTGLSAPSAGKTLCATATELYLDHIEISASEMPKALSDSLEKRFLGGHKTLSEVELQLAAPGRSGPASHAARLNQQVANLWNLQRLSIVLPLGDVPGHCKELVGLGRSAFLENLLEASRSGAGAGRTGGSGCGGSGCTQALFGERLYADRERAEKIWSFCSDSTAPTALQQAIDRTSLSLGKSVLQLRQDFGSNQTQSFVPEEKAAAMVKELRSSWQKVQTHMAAHFNDYSFATNVSKISSIKSSEEIHFQFHPVGALIKGASEQKALFQDERNIGPIFQSESPEDFLFDFKKGASGLVFSYHAGGVSISLAALAAINDEYSSGGVAVLPLPRETGAARDDFASAPPGPNRDALEGSGPVNDSPSDPDRSNTGGGNRAELDATTAQSEGVLRAQGDRQCL